MILVLDFGSQYTHLISRRIRKLGVYAEILPFDTSAERIIEMNPDGIVLSGGPGSVYEKDAPLPDRKIFELGIPVLGICYGAQAIAYMLGGDVRKAKVGEYGRAKINVLQRNVIFKELPSQFFVWMSHGDIILSGPEGAEKLAETDFSPVSAFKLGDIFGLQFHPEVYHTEYGENIIHNFVFGVCRAKVDWSLSRFVEDEIHKLSELDGGVLCAVSGGVDSTVLAVLLSRAKKDDSFFVLVDTGLLRSREAEKVRENFRRLGIEIDVVDASSEFISALKGISDPERKRKVVGEKFIRVFEAYAEDIKSKKGVKYLAQGTLYPDVIESGVSVSGKAHIIKTHHNVGGLPEKLGFEVVEPLRQLYKDEVREVGRILGIPEYILMRHPFPGPGLAVRIMGEVTPEKVRILQRAEEIFEEELIRWELYNEVWQAFCVLTNTKSTGVVGDRRRYGYVIAIRAVKSQDAMTADWAHLPYEFLDEVARKIVGEINEISRVVYDITTKPPATIEWE